MVFLLFSMPYYSLLLLFIILSALFGENKRSATARHELIDPAQNYTISPIVHNIKY
jgi:hypothetical protein